MNTYLTVVTDQARQVCLWNAPRPLDGDPVDIGLTGYTVQVTSAHPGALDRNRALDAMIVHMVTRAHAITTAQTRLAAEYGLDALDGFTDAMWLDSFAVHAAPCRILPS